MKGFTSTGIRDGADGIEVVNWDVSIGIGQVVMLRLLASRLREVNRVIESSAHKRSASQPARA